MQLTDQETPKVSRYAVRVAVLLMSALLTVIGLASVWVLDVARREQQRLESDARRSVENLIVLLDNRIDGHIQALQAITASPLLDLADLSGFREHAGRALKQQPLWTNILLASPDGFQVLNTRFPDPQDPVRVGDIDTFQAVVRTGKPVVGGVSLGPRSGAAAVIVRVPVLRETKTRFVLTAALKLSVVAELVRGALPEQWDGVVLDGDGRIVARVSDGDARAGELGSSAAREAVAAGRDGVFRVGRALDGDERVSLFLRSPLTGWTVHGEIPSSLLSARRTRSVLLAAAGAAASILLTALLSWLVYREIAARRMTEGRIHVLNRRLTRDNAELAALNKELEAFCYSVSHDLRTPLRAIDGFSQALIEDCADRLDFVGRSHLTRVREAAQHMGLLIDDLLKLARVSRAEVSFEKVDLGVLARVIVDALRADAPERPAEVAIASEVIGRGDPRLLRIALENLLDNAWKFTAGRSLARIEFGRTMNEAETAYYVRDNGVGFDMAYAGQLFRPFQRLHDARAFQGTGIGLATVQRIIHKHGGRVWAEAEPDKGATFYFTL